MTPPFRVLYVIDQLQHLGGAERTLLRLLSSLPRDRFEPRVLTFSFNREAFPSVACPLFVYPIRRIYGWNGFRYAVAFRRLLQAERIDIVHTFFESSDLWAAPLARVSRDVVLISSRRDLGIQRHRFHDLAYRLVSPLFDQVQAVSEGVRRYLLHADRLAPDRVVTIPNGIDVEAIAHAPRAEVRERYGWPPGCPVIVSLGNIRRVKGYDVLIRAAALVCRQFPARFVIAGRVLEPDHYRDLLGAVAEAGLENNVEFLGPVERVFDLLNAGDIFFLPSRSEGMSNALLEAMACCLPAVATRVGGNSELIADGKSGYLVPVGDAEAAATRLIELLNNPARAFSMGQVGRRLVESCFSLTASLGRVAQEYERLLETRRAR